MLGFMCGENQKTQLQALWENQRLLLRGKGMQCISLLYGKVSPEQRQEMAAAL